MSPNKKFLGIIANNSSIHILLCAIIIAFGILPYFWNGNFLLGGDGDYHLRYSNLVRYGFAWADDGIGVPVYAVGSVFPNIFIIKFLEFFITSTAVIKFIVYWSIIFLTFICAYLVCRQMDISYSDSFLIAFFYFCNPFTLNYFARLNMSLIIVFAAMMGYFFVILKYYNENYKLFFWFGLTSVLFTFANTNPPLFVVIQISILLSLAVSSCIAEKDFLIGKIAKKYMLISVSFVLFNFWWLINLAAFYFSGSAQEMYTHQTANNFLNLVAGGADSIIFRIFSFTSQIPTNTSVNFFASYFGSWISRIILLIPFLLVSLHVILSDKDSNLNKLLLHCFGLCVGISFLAKGVNPPFGNVFIVLFEKLPLFYIFKGPIEKFGILYVFVFSVCLMLIFKQMNKDNENTLFKIALAAYLVFCSVPLLSGNIFGDSLLPKYAGYAGENNRESLKYKDQPEFGQIREFLESDKSEYRVLGLPASRDYYAVSFKMYGNSYYSGIDPLLGNTTKSFMTYDPDTSVLYDNIAGRRGPLLAGQFNIKRIIHNGDLVPLYGFAQDIEVDWVQVLKDKFKLERKWGNKVSFKNKYFIPNIFAVEVQDAGR